MFSGTGMNWIRLLQLLPQLREKEWFDIPAYGTDEWANWMIDLHRKNM